MHRSIPARHCRVTGWSSADARHRLGIRVTSQQRQRLRRLSARAMRARVSADASGASAARTPPGIGVACDHALPNWLATSSRCESPSSQVASSSEKPLGAGGRHSGSPRSVCACMTGGHPGFAPMARRQPTIPSPGRLIACGRVPGFGRNQRLGDLLEIAVGLEEALGQPLHQRPGGSSATKWRASLRATCFAVAGWRRDRRARARPARSRRRSCAPMTVCGPGSCMRGWNVNSPPCAGSCRGGMMVQPVNTLANAVTSACV